MNPFYASLIICFSLPCFPAIVGWHFRLSQQTHSIRLQNFPRAILFICFFWPSDGVSKLFSGINMGNSRAQSLQSLANQMLQPCNFSAQSPNAWRTRMFVCIPSGRVSNGPRAADVRIRDRRSTRNLTGWKRPRARERERERYRETDEQGSCGDGLLLFS